MSETETSQSTSETSTTPEAKVETNKVPVETKAGEPKKKCTKMKGIIVAGLIVVVIILGVLYKLEKEGRSPITLFTPLIEKYEANKTVATVNGTTITNAQLRTGIEQYKQIASAQGIDVTDPAVQADIRRQALDVLINTELLKQEAVESGVTVSDDEIQKQIDTITEQLGGKEALQARMTELGIDETKLHSDIKDELLIQALLEKIFTDGGVSVTEEEITAAYDGAGGADAGLPALEEVHDQIEQQLTSSKQQAIVDKHISTLRESADINIVGDDESEAKAEEANESQDEATAEQAAVESGSSEEATDTSAEEPTEE